MAWRARRKRGVAHQPSHMEGVEGTREACTSRSREGRSGRRKNVEARTRIGGGTVGMCEVGGIDADVLVLFDRVILLGNRPRCAASAF